MTMKCWKLAAAVTVILASSSANASFLESRLGGLAYYDDDANLTWLADANYAMTHGYNATGLLHWSQAETWAAELSIGGVAGWRLADTVQPDAGCGFGRGSLSYGYNCAASEMGNLFYNVLGNREGSISNTGPFSNVQSGGYWSATEWAPVSHNAWFFDMGKGYQDWEAKRSLNYAWAVQSGDVGAVPVPAAVWLFGSGLLGMVGVARRRQRYA